MTFQIAIELLMGIALAGFGVCSMLAGDAPEGQGRRGRFRASGRENLVLGMVELAAGASLLLHAMGVL